MKFSRSQKIFILAMLIFVAYGIFSRMAHYFSDDDSEILLKKLLKIVLGLMFIIILLAIYFKNKNTSR